MLISPASLALVAALVGRTAATSYCQCEAPAHDRIFPGINEPCNDPLMDDGWCSTNCNVFGASCDYCQWVPAGFPPDRGVDMLKNWCFQQSGYDISSGESYIGTDVFCYSNANKASCNTCTGCAYHDNPVTKKRDSAMMSPAIYGRQDGKSSETNGSSPQASVTVDAEPVEGEAGVKRDCLFMFPNAAEKMSDDLTEDPQCSMNGKDDNHFTVVCSGIMGTVDGVVGKFSEYCASYGGQENDGIEVKRAEDVRVHFVD